MASKNENHTSRQALKEENEAKNVKYKPLPCEWNIHFYYLIASFLHTQSPNNIIISKSSANDMRNNKNNSWTTYFIVREMYSNLRIEHSVLFLLHLSRSLWTHFWCLFILHFTQMTTIELCWKHCQEFLTLITLMLLISMWVFFRTFLSWHKTGDNDTFFFTNRAWSTRMLTLQHKDLWMRR